MKTPRERYKNDNHFRILVDMMISHIDQCNYTPSEMRQAAVLASIIYTETNIRQLCVPAIPKSVVDGLEVMEKWYNENWG